MQGLTLETLAEGKRLHESATPGPWAVDDSPYSSYTWGPKMEMISDECGHCASYRLRGHGGGLPQEANATLIAWMRTNLPALLAAAESVGKLGDEAEQLRVQLAGCGAAALGNTERCIASRAKPGDYGYSASYQDVCNAVDREISLRAQLTAIGKALRAYPDSDLVSLAETVATRNEVLEAQLTAREQENDVLHSSVRYWLGQKAAAEAEVERLKVLMREVIDDSFRTIFQAGGGEWEECRFCAISYRHDEECIVERLKSALAPSQPPQTTETRG